MYTLRIIEKNGVIENHYLGTSYARIRKNTTEEFNSIMKEQYPDEDISDIDSLLCAENGKIFFIIKTKTPNKRNYFIMTDSGNTFEKL
jgi:hypothetical protein